MTIRITRIAGNLRRESFTPQPPACRRAPTAAGLGCTFWDGLGGVPPFSEHAEAGPASLVTPSPPRSAPPA